ncbi:hypothetical protein DM435_03230 [Shigella flexneri]|nr:hypothetical protein [Shigella flexneri]EGE2637481.1 hypothetical protein [Shigella flexneri]
MKKILLAIMLAGTAFASQAGTLVSQGTEASANLTLTKPIVVNNTIQPVKGVYSGTLTAWTPLATGIVGASDGQSHDYAVTFPDDIYAESSTSADAVISGDNNPDHKLKVSLTTLEQDPPSAASEEIGGKRYMMLKNTGTGGAYRVVSHMKEQVVEPDSYTIRTQAYIYAE